MSGNDGPIDLNSDVVSGDRESDTHGFNPVDPVSDALKDLGEEEVMDFDQTKAENSSRDFGEDEVKDVPETNTSQEGLCRLDQNEADASMDYKAGNGDFLEGLFPDYVEMRPDVTDSGVKIHDEPSVVRNDLSEVERECSERIHVLEKVPVGCGDEIMTDDNKAVHGVADATNGHYSVCDLRNVESREGIFMMQGAEWQVARGGELASGYVHDNASLNHGDGIQRVADINPEVPGDDIADHGDVDDSVSLHDNLQFDAPADAENTRQLTENLSKKAEKLTEGNELSPVPALECLKNQTREVGGGQTDEKDAIGHYFPKTEGSIDVDEENLFDVVIEMDPNIVIDEKDVFDDVNANSTNSVLEFKVSDLVWGKVRSHPWWPGQICHPSASSKKAMKYFKEDRYLIAFFGDNSFAWKEASMIKPFQEYFSAFRKQSDLESFHCALNCALEELSRRIEFGLSCPCLPKELYSRLQVQDLSNAGVRKKASKIYGGDSSLTALFFDTVKLINTVKEVARTPYGEADSLEPIQAQAQLKAFNRWKGWYELPEFHIHKIVLNYTEGENDYPSELLEDIVIDLKDDEVTPYGRENFKAEDSSSGKRKGSSENCTYPKKKGKKLSDLMSREPHNISCNENQLRDAIWNDPAVKPSTTHVSTQSAKESGQTDKSLRVGDRIRRVACILNESSPIFKHDNGVSKKAVAMNKGNEEPTKEPNCKLMCMECPLDEVLSRLCLAATDPLKGLAFQNVINFFSDFRNSICLRGQETGEIVSDDETEHKLTTCGKRKKFPASAEGSDSEFMKDSYWTDRLIQGIAEDQPPLENKNQSSPSEKGIPAVTEQERQSPPEMNCTIQEPHEHANVKSENSTEEVYPTALILNFTNLSSVPSETNLNDIFRKYGALYESKTEIMKKSNRAKVVFKKSCDAETAFSSAGKYSIFGPSLVSYRLKYLPPFKDTPAKRRRKGLKSQEENPT